MTSYDSVAEAMRRLRWSVDSAPECEVVPGIALRLIRDMGAWALRLTSTLTPDGSRKYVFREVPQAHMETRGRSQWLRDNTWRLSPAGVEFWANNLYALIHAREQMLAARDIPMCEHGNDPRYCEVMDHDA